MFVKPYHAAYHVEYSWFPGRKALRFPCGMLQYALTHSHCFQAFLYFSSWLRFTLVVPPFLLFLSLSHLNILCRIDLDPSSFFCILLPLRNGHLDHTFNLKRADRLHSIALSACSSLPTVSELALIVISAF